MFTTFCTWPINSWSPLFFFSSKIDLIYFLLLSLFYDQCLLYWLLCAFVFDDFSLVFVLLHFELQTVNFRAYRTMNSSRFWYIFLCIALTRQYVAQNHPININCSENSSNTYTSNRRVAISFEDCCCQQPLLYWLIKQDVMQFICTKLQAQRILVSWFSVN